MKPGRGERVNERNKKDGKSRSKVCGFQLPSALINGFVSLHKPRREEEVEGEEKEEEKEEEASGYDHGSVFENLL